MSAPHQSHDARLAFRRWEVSVWQYLLDEGPQTTESLYLSRLTADEEDLTMGHLSGRLSTMRRRGMLTHKGTKFCTWKAVPAFNIAAYLYSPELEQQAIHRQAIYAYLLEHGQSTVSEIRQAVGSDLTRLKLWHALESMHKLGMLDSEVIKAKRVYSASLDFNMRAYMDSIPKAPQPEPAHTDTMAGLRLETYVPDAPEPEQPPEFVGPRYCPDVAAPRHHDVFETVYRPKPWVNPRG